MSISDDFINGLREAARDGVAVDADAALAILLSDHDLIPEILAAATAMRKRQFGDKLSFCSIVNAKSGACSEDCAFCAQSGHHQTEASIYGLIESDEIKRAHDSAGTLPVSHFGVVTSGDGLSGDEFEQILATVKNNNQTEVSWCASLGSLTVAQLSALKAAGLKRFHHNLETAESFFPNICSTHSYADRLQTLRACMEVGLEVCCGGLLGLGESLEQRVELALALQREGVDSIPLNFLVPIEGTRLGDRDPVAPLDIIRCTAMFRMTNPRSEIKVCAGRTHLRDLQSMLFYAGATGMMLGDLLTVAGRDVTQDLQMLDDLEVDYAR